MTKHPAFGLFLATFGALTLTPDAMFMRWSEMSGVQMQAWRGLCMGGVFLLVWTIVSPDRRGDLAALGLGASRIVMVAQFFNAALFAVGIALAPVAIILLGVATAPVWAALLSALLYKEHASRATWIAIALVMTGIVIAVSGKNTGDFAPIDVILGIVCGLGVALALALNFAVLRHRPQVPLLLTIGIGAFASGLVGLALTGPARMFDGEVWAILVPALVILPVSFLALSQAARYTVAANVSLLMLMETVLGPAWVWAFAGEAPTQRMMLGGAIVIGTLAIYLSRQVRKPADSVARGA